MFSGYFVELLNRSELALQETFTQSWGPLYSQNAQVFSDLYTELRRYCRSANLNLEEVLNDFWTRLLEKLFNQANRQYLIGILWPSCNIIVTTRILSLLWGWVPIIAVNNWLMSIIVFTNKCIVWKVPFKVLCIQNKEKTRKSLDCNLLLFLLCKNSVRTIHM